MLVAVPVVALVIAHPIYSNYRNYNSRSDTITWGELLYAEANTKATN